jgi:hypothetical protein
MANLNSKLEITTTTGKSYDCIMEDNYTEVYQNINVVDNTDGFIELASLSKTNASALKGSKLLVLKNNSPVGVELQFHINEFNDSSNVDQYTEDLRITQLLGANEYMVIPNQYMIGYATDASASNAKTIDNKGGYDVNSGNLYRPANDTIGNLLIDDASGINSTDTTVGVDNGNFFRVGDLLRLEDEIVEVTAISTNDLTIRRGLHGSTAASHADDVVVRFPFFNKYSDYDAFTHTQTNSSGRFGMQNLFGYGRSRTYPTGIVKGSFSMKFYNNGYQELGLSGVTSASNSGLTASTAYQFIVAVDGGSDYDVDFTTDATDLSVGKVLSLIQAQFDSAYYASSGNLKNKKLTVGIVNGDIRFTSGQRTRVSAVELKDSSGSDTDLWSQGIFPAVADVETAIPALLPDDVIYTKDTYIQKTNMNVFSYDDGKGNILGGEASGTINYETGAIDFTGPANAEFVASFNYDSAHSGGLNASSNEENGIITISARSVNSKINAEVELLGFV